MCVREQEEKRRGLLKVRLEMAKFLQETIREGGLKASDKVKTSDEFKEFFRKVCVGGRLSQELSLVLEVSAHAYSAFIHLRRSVRRESLRHPKISSR